MYAVILSRQAKRDKRLLKQAGLETKAKALLIILVENPFKNPPRYEKLKGDLEGFYSRRVNQKHRIVYTVDQETHIVHVTRMWTHYE